jgi:hypothetical protein
MVHRSFRLTAAVVAALVSTTCGGPSNLVTESVSAPVSVPSTTPSKAPVVPATALSACERIGYGDPKAQCSKGAPQLLGEISVAMDRLIAKQPGLFEQGALAPWGDPRIVDQDKFYAALIAELDSMGVCAVQNPNSMIISVKSNNDWSEEYQPVTSGRYPWRSNNSYLTGCSPASFPRAPIDHIDYIFVTAYSFKCDPESALSLTTRGSKPAFPTTCDAYVTATPKTFDHVDVPKDVHGPDIEWELVEGNVALDQWDSQKFNQMVHPSGPGPLKICATVQGVRGCLAGQILVPPTPAPSASK